MRRRRELLGGVLTVGIGSLAGCGETTGEQTPASEEAGADTPTSTPEEQTPAEDGDESTVARTAPTGVVQFDDSILRVLISREQSMDVTADGTQLVVPYRHSRADGAVDGGIQVVARSDGEWQMESVLTVPEAELPEARSAGFQAAVSDDGRTVLTNVSRGEEYTNYGYAFGYQDGTWTRSGVLEPTNFDSDSGHALNVESIALSGDGGRALLGMPLRNDTETNSGAGVIFSRSDGTWREEAELTVADVGRSQQIGVGSALSRDGTTAVLGAKGREETEYVDGTLGRVFVFERSGGSWEQTATLTKGDEPTGTYFGNRVAVSADGGTVVAGEVRRNEPYGTNNGAAHIFRRSSGNWSREATVIAPDGAEFDSLGRSVALSRDGSLALVGATEADDDEGNNAGAAYLLERDGGRWTLREKLVAGRYSGARLIGLDVAFADSGRMQFAGANRTLSSEERSGPDDEFGGAVYVYE